MSRCCNGVEGVCSTPFLSLVERQSMERAHLQKTVVLLVSLLSLSSASAAQRVTNLPSLSQFLSEDLSTTIVGIDYRGEAEKSPTLFFATKGTEVDWDHLRAVPGLEISDWGNRYTRLTFTVTVEDMKQFIEAVKTVVIANQETEPWLSLMVVAGSGPQQKAFLGSVSHQKAGEFFILTRNALRADPKDISIMNGAANYGAMSVLQSFGCALGLLPQAIPAKDVTNAVAVTRGGLRFNYQEHRFESIVSLRNISGEPIRAPISLVVDLSQNISLANAHGRTCVTTPVGREFITIPIPTELFKPGQILETILMFTGPVGEDVEFTTKVLATPGER